MGYLYKRGRIWWCKYYVNGRPVQESTEHEKHEDARTFLKEREGEVAQGRITPRGGRRMRFEDLAQDYENDYQINGRRSLKRAKKNVAHLMPFFRGYRAVNITTAHVRAYTAKRQEAGAANGTINRELTALRRMFNLALQAEKIRHKPHIPHLKENNTRQGFFEAGAFQAVLKHLPAPVQSVAAFAYITGWRVQSETLPLTWAQVDFADGEIRLEPGTTKNDEGRTFPMFPELRALLERQRAVTREIQLKQDRIIPWVFHRKGKPIKSFRKAWATACKKAGQPGRIPHDFRRTAVRNMVRKGIPERVAMQLSGHKTRSVFERYNIVSEGDLREAGRKLTGTFTGTMGHFAVDSPAVTVQNYSNGPVAQADRAEVS